MNQKQTTTDSAGKNQQIETIYLEYKDKISAYVYGKVSNKQDREDIVSSVFFNVVNKFHTYDAGKASVSTWIYTITHNAVIDYYRKQQKHMEHVDYAYVQLEDVADESGQEDILDSLADALLTLKPKEKDLIVLHYYKGYKLKEIAEMMEMSYINAKVIHRKALDKIREHMKLQ